MNKLIEGQISFSGIREALESVIRLGSVKNGVLRITSNEASGLIGVFCGRFVTGAVLTLSGETGHKALVKLLSSRDGTFAFLDAADEVLPDLMQSLGVDLQKLISTNEFSDHSVLTEETLTGLTGSADEIKAFDTTFDLADLSEAERLSRITRTYEKLLSLSYKRRSESQPELVAQVAAADTLTDLPAQQPTKQAANQADFAPSPAGATAPAHSRPQVASAPVQNSQPQAPAPAKQPAIPPWDIPYTPPLKDEAPGTTFTRLKKWTAHQDSVWLVSLLSMLAILALFLWYTWPSISHLLGGGHH